MADELGVSRTTAGKWRSRFLAARLEGLTDVPLCEHCGCRALATIDELTREHDLVVDMISEARAAYAASDTGRMADLARQVAAVLGPHTAVEERGLFPALTADFPDYVAGLTAEQRRVEAGRDEAAGIPADPAWPARFIEALAVWPAAADGRGPRAALDGKPPVTGREPVHPIGPRPANDSPFRHRARQAERREHGPGVRRVLIRLHPRLGF